jgi:hypothetical protein
MVVVVVILFVFFFALDYGVIMRVSSEIRWKIEILEDNNLLAVNA